MKVYNRCLLFSAVLLLLGACEEKKDEGRDLSSNCEASLPPLVLDCSVCHSFDTLQKVVNDESVGVREWLALRGEGLVRVVPVMPEHGWVQTTPWPERGRHPNAAMGDCSGCHPVHDNGLGHGVCAYPEAVATSVFEGGADCGGSCHPWLSSTITASGFENASGETPSYRGSARPADLLRDSDNAHSSLWKQGVQGLGFQVKIGTLNPGCGGCHNAQAESHGSMLACVDCHTFKIGEELHTNHTRVISQRGARNDPQFPSSNQCLYCHFEDESAVGHSRAVCYNCHLGGHQPLNAEGQAHFWPVEE